MSKKKDKFDHYGKIMEYKKLIKRKKPPTPDYSKVTVKALKFQRPKPVPKLRKIKRSKVRIRSTLSVS